MRALLIGLVVCGVAGAAPVSGDVDYAGERWRAADAIAYACEDGGTCVAIAAARFDRAAFLADGVIDSVDVHEHQPDGARYLVLSFDGEGILRDVGAYGPTGGSNQSDESMLAAFTLEAFADDRVAGALDYDFAGDRIRVRFDTTIEAAVSSE